MGHLLAVSLDGRSRSASAGLAPRAERGGDFGDLSAVGGGKGVGGSDFIRLRPHEGYAVFIEKRKTMQRMLAIGLCSLLVWGCNGAKKLQKQGKSLAVPIACTVAADSIQIQVLDQDSKELIYGATIWVIIEEKVVKTWHTDHVQAVAKGKKGNGQTAKIQYPGYHPIVVPIDTAVQCWEVQLKAMTPIVKSTY